MALLAVAAVAAAILIVMDPVSDIPYYLGSLFCIVASALAMVSLVKVYNVISTRPLPQFNRSGGEDNA